MKIKPGLHQRTELQIAPHPIRERDDACHLRDELLVRLAGEDVPVAKHGIFPIPGSAGVSSSYSVRFPTADGSAPTPMTSAEVDKAFAFKTDQAGTGPDLKHISSLIAKLVLLGFVAGLVYLFVRSLGSLFGP